MGKIKEKTKYIITKRLFYTLLCCVFLSQIISKIATCYFDTDTWFILAEGRDIVKNGIKYTHTFTVIPDLKIVVQQWLWCVITYGIYDAAGNAGLFALVLAEASMIAVLFYKLGKKKNVDTELLVVLDIVFLFLIGDFLSTRPNAPTIILLLLQLLMLEDYKEKNDTKAGVKLAIGLSLITLFEINIHASLWIFHFVFLLPYVFPPINTFATNFYKREYNIKPILLSCIPMSIALFINPYGLNGIMYIVNAYGDALYNIGIAEMQRIELTSLVGALLAISFVFYVSVYVTTKKQMDAEVFYLFAGTFILGCMCYRNYYYAAIGFFVLLTDALRNTRFEKVHDFINHQSKLVMFLTAFALGIAVSFAIGNGSYVLEDWDAEPVEAVSYLNEYAEPNATVYTEYNNGSFVEYAGYKVYIDARAELYLKKINGKEEIIDEFLDVYNSLNLEKYRSFKQKYCFDYYLVTEATLMDAFLQTDPQCQLVVEGNGYRLYQATTDEPNQARTIP